MNVCDIQAQRKAVEREPIDWDTYRQALIDSGMVEEARKRREHGCAMPPTDAEERYLAWVRDQSASREWIRFENGSSIAVLGVEPGDIRGTQTLVDFLWNDRFGGVGDES
jgi:hypothetical protein